MRWLAACAVLLVAMSAMAGQAQLSAPASAATGFGPSRAALKDIPADKLAIYQAKGAQYNLDWTVLAGVGSVESNHDRPHCPTSSAGARGMMQFEPATWATWGKGADICDPVASVDVAARYLMALGAPADWTTALARYNCGSACPAGLAYAAAVLAKSAEYRGAPTTGGSGDYRNPFPAPAWLPARTDQGVDWIPTRPLPVRAIGDCVVTFSTTSSGWPGGAFFTYRLLSGDHAGLFVFTAEHLRGLPRVGERFRAGQRMATAEPGFPFIETGFAAGPGEQVATPYNGALDGTAMPAGKAFARWLRELGAQPLDDPGSGSDRP